MYFIQCTYAYMYNVHVCISSTCNLLNQINYEHYCLKIGLPWCLMIVHQQISFECAWREDMFREDKLHNYTITIKQKASLNLKYIHLIQ